MAARRTKNRNNKHYVKTGRRKGANTSILARRSSTIILLFVVLLGMLFGIKRGFDWVGRKLYSENATFEIQHLIVSCDGKLTEDRIREYTGLREGMNLWETSFDEIENNLSKVPDIESVYLKRKLPHTLIIKVKERIPVARIAGKKVPRFPNVVDRYGVVLRPRRSAESLPLIKGVDSSLQMGVPMEHIDVKTALRIIALCDSTGYLRSYVRIESLDVKYSDFIDMRLHGGIRVRMPRFSLKPKLQNLATVIKIANGQGRRVKEVDLTLDSAKVPVTYY
ncbi:MAG TPA: FtsQ-type POTRA domain-containing protein [Pontiella sp.]